MTRPLAVALALALVGVAGCGSTSPGEQALERAETNLTRIRSGTLSMIVLASTPGVADGRGAGFELAGPFAVAEEEGRLPVARLTYTRVTGTTRRVTTFVSTGEEAFVELDGRAWRLDPAQVADLRARGDGKAGGGGLEGLNLEAWVERPRVGPGPAIDGVATDRIIGDLDAAAAVNDLLALSQRFGAGEDELPRRLEGEGAERVRRAVRSARVEILTGRGDGLLRHLEVVMEMGVEGAEEVRAALGDLAGVRLRLVVDVRGVNEPVRVEAPVGARPVAERGG